MNTEHTADSLSFEVYIEFYAGLSKYRWINQQLTNHSYTSTEILDLSSFLFWKSCVKFDIHLDTQLLGYVKG